MTGKRWVGTIHFVRDALPNWPAYADAHGITLHGGGAEVRANCGIHCGERFSLAINTASGAWVCHSCGAVGGDVLSYHRLVHGLSFADAARELGAWADGLGDRRPGKALTRPVGSRDHTERRDTDQYKRARAAAIWSHARPIEPDSPASHYLVGRCCVVPPAAGDLRWHPHVEIFGFTGPAMVGRMTLATDYRESRGLHLTWLEQNKAGWHRTERRYLGPKAGCVVRLWPDEAVTLGLGVAEGIESALSLAHAISPVWACLDASNLGTLPVLNGIEALTIAADNDDAGIAAVQACADRWSSTGAEVRVVVASAKADINDVARVPA